MQKMISTSDEQFYFDGRMVQKGEVFDAEEKFVFVLGVAGRAEPFEGKESGSPEQAGYETSDVEASNPRSKKRGYNRRDMQAREPRQ
jgi:hypothetical protein